MIAALGSALPRFTIVALRADGDAKDADAGNVLILDVDGADAARRRRARAADLSRGDGHGGGGKGGDEGEPEGYVDAEYEVKECVTAAACVPRLCYWFQGLRAWWWPGHACCRGFVHVFVSAFFFSCVGPSSVLTRSTAALRQGHRADATEARRRARRPIAAARAVGAGEGGAGTGRCAPRVRAASSAGGCARVLCYAGVVGVCARF